MNRNKGVQRLSVFIVILALMILACQSVGRFNPFVYGNTNSHRHVYADTNVYGHPVSYSDSHIYAHGNPSSDRHRHRGTNKWGSPGH